MAATDFSIVTISPRRVGADDEGGSTVVWLHGDHDVSTAAEVEAAMARAIVIDDDANLVVDVSGVEFMDASTIGLIVRARNNLLPLSRSLMVRGPTTPTRRLFEVCHLEPLLEPAPCPELTGSTGGAGQ